MPCILPLYRGKVTALLMPLSGVQPCMREPDLRMDAKLMKTSAFGCAFTASTMLHDAVNSQHKHGQ